MKTNNEEYWEITANWIAATQKRYKGRSSNDLTQIFMCGPFSGWSEREVKELADRMYEAQTKFPVWPEQKSEEKSG